MQANLAELLAARGELDAAFGLFTSVLEHQRQTIADVASFASERQRMDLLRDLRTRVSQYLSLAIRHFSDSPAHIRRAADLVLDRKALGADLLARQREAILSARYPELRERLERLSQLRAWIAQRSLAGPGASAPEAAEEQLRQARLNREALERELAREIPELAARWLDRAADCAAVADAIPPQSVVVEFLRYGAFDFTAIRSRGDDPWQPPRYLTIIIGPGRHAEPALVDLGDAARIDELVATLRSQITGAQEQAAGAARDLARLPAEPTGTADADAGGLLRAAVIDPLTEAIGAADRLLLAPDGDLLLLPFEMLPGRDGRQLIDSYAISYLTAARDIVRLRGHTGRPASPPLVIAAPDYDAGAATPRGEPFCPLPGTRQEGERVAELLGVQPLLGGEAVKTAVEACSSPRVLHLATHGFFLPPERSLSPDEFEPGMTVRGIDTDRQMMVLDGILATPMQFVAANEAFERLSGRGLSNPLLRAGLALAGANTWLRGDAPPPAAGNGVLTAEEVSGLDLSGTELVVLSACETGLGEVEPGEGVFGFRRSFVLAGARTVVLSLWKVPDEQTRQLMEDFYRLLQDRRPRAEALREAQLRLRAQRPSASSWAAFICQGDYGPLPDPAGSA